MFPARPLFLKFSFFAFFILSYFTTLPVVKKIVSACSSSSFLMAITAKLVSHRCLHSGKLIRAINTNWLPTSSYTCISPLRNPKQTLRKYLSAHPRDLYSYQIRLDTFKEQPDEANTDPCNSFSMLKLLIQSTLISSFDRSEPILMVSL